jgi:CheY-specific phosphatase CheX
MEPTDLDESLPLSARTREEILEPFISGVSVALGEMADAAIVVKTIGQKATSVETDCLTAIIKLNASREGTLVLIVPASTAAALASRVLASVGTVPDVTLIRDCIGEVANVIAGQAKALLAGTPHAFTFSVPMVISGAEFASRPRPIGDCYDVALSCEFGSLLMRLSL